MVTDRQLPLINVPPTLTPRLQAVYEDVRHAGPEGITAAEIGRFIHERNGKHGRTEHCVFDQMDGFRALADLRRKGYVRESRKVGGWVAIAPVEVPADHPPDFRPGERATFGQFPAGFGRP